MKAKDLFAAMDKFEDGMAPGDDVEVTLFSDGSGFVSGTQSGDLYHFGNLQEAYKYLMGDWGEPVRDQEDLDELFEEGLAEALKDI